MSTNYLSHVLKKSVSSSPKQSKVNIFAPLGGRRSYKLLSVTLCINQIGPYTHVKQKQAKAEELPE